MKKFFRIALQIIALLLLGLIALAVLLYFEENWRGARAWAATKAMWEARGISFDPSTHFPPPVPDAQNIAALPLFQLEPDPDDRTMLIAGPLRRALLSGDENHSGPGLPSAGYSWQMGQSPDFVKLDASIAQIYAKVLHSQPAGGDSLAHLETIYPFIAELNRAAAERPFFRPKENYDSKMPWASPLGLLTSQIGLVRCLSLHALLALNEKHPDVAMTDIRTTVKIMAGTSREPSLVSGLVTAGLENIAVSAVSHGLTIHAWDDSQLAELQSLLAGLDPLANYQSVMRGECVAYSLPMMEFIKRQQTRHDSGWSFMIDGWLDQNRAHIADDLLGAAGTSDLRTHRVFVDESEGMREHAEDGRWPLWAPWNMLSNMSVGPILSSQMQFARAQVWLDEARIACALERYRLTHGSYPATLDALAPACIDAVPNDPINGEPYRYRVRPEGTFLLYSVGWNQKDDGGVAVFDLPANHDPYDSPAKHADWVWPTPKSAP